MITVDVPERITRSDLRHMLEPLGMNLDDLVALRFEMDGIHAIMYARNAEGRRYAVANGDLAKHDVQIPLVD